MVVSDFSHSCLNVLPCFGSMYFRFHTAEWDHWDALRKDNKEGKAHPRQTSKNILTLQRKTKLTNKRIQDRVVPIIRAQAKREDQEPEQSFSHPPLIVWNTGSFRIETASHVLSPARAIRKAKDTPNKEDGLQKVRKQQSTFFPSVAFSALASVCASWTNCAASCIVSSLGYQKRVWTYTQSKLSMCDGDHPKTEQKNQTGTTNKNQTKQKQHKKKPENRKNHIIAADKSALCKLQQLMCWRLSLVCIETTPKSKKTQLQCP